MQLPRLIRLASLYLQHLLTRPTPRAAGGHHLRVEYGLGKGIAGFGRDREIRLEIDLPQRAGVTCTSGSADLTITGELESLSYRSGSGDLVFGTIRGTALVKSGSGNIHGEKRGSRRRDPSRLGRCPDREGLRMGTFKTASGDILVGTASGSVQAVSVSGDVSIGSAWRQGRPQLRSVSGDISVGVAKGTRVWLDLGSGQR